MKKKFSYGQENFIKALKLNFIALVNQFFFSLPASQCILHVLS